MGVKSIAAGTFAVFANIAYPLSGIIAFVAAYEFFAVRLHTIIAILAALFISSIPGVGSGFSAYAAHEVWGWSYGSAIAVMFSPWLLVLIVAAFAARPR